MRKRPQTVQPGQGPATPSQLWKFEQGRLLSHKTVQSSSNSLQRGTPYALHVLTDGAGGGMSEGALLIVSPAPTRRHDRSQAFRQLCDPPGSGEVVGHVTSKGATRVLTLHDGPDCESVFLPVALCGCVWLCVAVCGVWCFLEIIRACAFVSICVLPLCLAFVFLLARARVCAAVERRQRERSREDLRVSVEMTLDEGVGASLVDETARELLYGAARGVVLQGKRSMLGDTVDLKLYQFQVSALHSCMHACMHVCMVCVCVCVSICQACQACQATTCIADFSLCFFFACAVVAAGQPTQLCDSQARCGLVKAEAEPNVRGSTAPPAHP